MGFSAFSTTLYALLDENKATLGLAEVWNHDCRQFDTFPAAVVTVRDGEETLLDTGNNQLTYTFIVRIVDSQKGIAETEARMRSVVDTVLALLRSKDNDWGANVLKVSPVSVSWDWANYEHPTRVAELSITMTSHEAI